MLVLAHSLLVLAAAAPPGVVVELAQPGFAAQQAGLAPGDVLMGWERAAAPPANPDSAAGEIHSPLDLERIEIEQAPRGALWLRGTRDGQPLRVRVPPGEWRLESRPLLGAEQLALYEEARKWVGAGEYDKGLSLWRERALAFQGAADHARAAWLFYRVGTVAAEQRSWPAADAAFVEALQEATTASDVAALALIHGTSGRFLDRRNEWDAATRAYREALEAYQALASPSLGEAQTLNSLGRVARRRGDLTAAEDYVRRGLAMAEALAPESLVVVASLNQLGIVASWRDDLKAAEESFKRALSLSSVLAPASLDVALSLDNLGIVTKGRGDLGAAEEHSRRALALRETLAPESLDVADSLSSLGNVARARSDLDGAEEYERRAFSLREKLTPQSLGVAASLNNLGATAFARGDLAAAEDYWRRALALRERLAPDSLDAAGSLNNLGAAALARGDLAAAEDYGRRSLALKEKLAPGSLAVASSLANLGLVALKRNDLDTAEDHYERTLAIRVQLAPESLETSSIAGNLGRLAMQRGDHALADDFYQRALALREKLAPDSLHVASSLSDRGELAWKRGQAAAAREHLERALAIEERIAPTSMDATESLRLLGDVARGDGDIAAAEAYYRRSLDIRRELAPGSADEAEACQRLATIERRNGRPELALDLYRRALQALDTQRTKLGGTDAVRSSFAAEHASYYREAIDLLMELRRPEEAFHVLERQRARAFLALLAERDLVFSTDVPAELDRERRIANAEYDRALAGLVAPKGATPEARETLARSRQRQGQIQELIRSAAPRLAALQYPEPVDLASAREALPPGTLLLSYSIGDQSSYLFALGPGAGDFVALALDTSLPKLRGDVARWRELLPPRRTLRVGPLQLAARRLSDTLLAPVARLIAGAERVVIVPDGPLHLIPFAALADPTTPGHWRYLVETKPVSVAASATVLAELRKRRRPALPAQLVAFGDPDYDRAGSASAPRPLPVSRAVGRRADWQPLPASRAEVRGIEKLYPGTARTYLGSAATEERAKQAVAQASLVHFACHAFADSAAPLDSYLALSTPRQWSPGQENGLLQAWEVFEQLRIDADLVTLSACGTALGKEVSGEGLLGLTRAFQYAGARSVLASLWEVNDTSSARLMQRFYAFMKAGKAKDAALRAAQVDMLREPYSHPRHWAAFELIGDWQ